MPRHASEPERSGFSILIQELSVIQDRLQAEHGHELSVLQHENLRLKTQNAEMQRERSSRDLQIADKLGLGVDHLRELSGTTTSAQSAAPSLTPPRERSRDEDSSTKFQKMKATPRLGEIALPHDVASVLDVPGVELDTDDVRLEPWDAQQETSLARYDDYGLKGVCGASGQICQKPIPEIVGSGNHDMPIAPLLSHTRCFEEREKRSRDLSLVRENHTRDFSEATAGKFQGGQSGTVPRSGSTEITSTSSTRGNWHTVRTSVAKTLGELAHTNQKRTSVFSFQTEEQAMRDQAVKMSETLDDASDGTSGHHLIRRNCYARVVVLVHSMHFEMFFALVIITNAVFMGFYINDSVMHPHRATHAMFYIVGYFYTCIFTVELALRMIAHGWSFFTSRSNWHWHYLDLFIVLSSLMEVLFDLITFSGGQNQSNSLGNVRIVRIIRITRLIKVFRVARIVRFVRALRTLVYSIICTLKSVVWAMLLLFMNIYVFGMVFAQAVSDHVHEDSSGIASPGLQLYWGTFPRSMFTLYKAISGGVSWHDVVYPLGELEGYWICMFVFYVSFTYFAVLNVITGVFCEAAIESARQDHELVIQQHLVSKNKYMQQIRTLFAEFDDDGSTIITFKELEDVLQDENTVAFLATLELDATDAWELFKLLDEDASHTIDIDEFVTGCMRLKGAAKAIDIAKISYDMKLNNKKFSKALQTVEAKIDGIAATLKAHRTLAHSLSVQV